MKKLSEIMNPNPRTDSPIEEMLLTELEKYDLYPVSQYPIGLFFIDLAFPNIKLAIEADGHEFHSSVSQKERDKYRQEKIEKLGWKFERFSGSDIYKHYKMIAAKIAIKYFSEIISAENKKIALGNLVSYLSKSNLNIAIDITNAYLEENRLDDFIKEIKSNNNLPKI